MTTDREPSESIETDWLKQWARFARHAVAFQDAETGATYSYGALYYLSCCIARVLRERFDIRHGDRVAILAQNEFEYVPLFFAIQRLGAIMVPLNYRLSPRELSRVIDDAEPSLVIVQNTFLSQIQDPMASGAPTLAYRKWAFDRSENRADIRADRHAAGDHAEGSVVELVKKALLHRKDVQSQPGWQVPSLSRHEDPCMILYTSGTTGSPKGALITNKMLHWNSLNTSLRLNLSQTDVAISFLPFFHTSGWNVLLTPFVHRGAKTILMRKFDPARVLALCEAAKVTVLFGVPTTLERLVRQENFVSADLSSVRFAIVGGEPMPLDLIKTWQIKGVPIRQGYGLTEFGPGVFSLNQEDAIRKIGSIGLANFYVETRVVDDQEQDVGTNQVGELLLRGPVCTRGYWRRPDLTAEVIRGGWFRTGDLVRFDADGFHYIVGRKKDMFISGGENVYPAEVEQVLSSHPEIREVAVIGVADASWGEVGRAFVSLRAGSRLTLEDLTAFCADQLAKYKIPKSMRILDELPKGDSGKILKKILPQL